jgi:GDP-L-fucose synthase
LEREAAILVAGADGFPGDAIARRLRAEGCTRVLGDAGAPDLRDAAAVDAFFAAERPTYVFLAAGRAGGIGANQREPAELMLDNLLVQTHVLRAAQRAGVRKLVYLASACVYPRECPQPMRPEQLGSGPLEPTSEAYATAKLAGIALCRAYAQQYGARFVAAIPANVFGPGDDFDPAQAHVVGALVQRMSAARARGDAEVAIWGSGRARRDFLFVDDLADACVFLMRRYDGEAPVNVSGGLDLSVGEIAERVRRAVGYEGRLVFDPSRLDGAPRKLLDGEPLRRLGWSARTPLDLALAATARWLAEHGAGAAAHG